MLDYIIIGMLMDAAYTGYDIKKHIEEGIGIFYKASYGSLYPALKRLTEKELLAMTVQPEGGRQKKYYIATKYGKKVFYQWLCTPSDSVSGSENTLVKVYFFDKLEQSVRENLLKEFERKHIAYLRKLLELEKKFDKLENRDCFYFKLSTLYYGIKITQDNINWCRHLLNKQPLENFVEDML